MKKMIDKYNEVGIPTGVLEHTETANMAMTGNATAKPMEECKYPLCEECARYVGHYCTVPIVVSKQQWLILEGKMWEWYKRMDDLENLVTDEILGSGEPYIATEEERNAFTPLQKYWYDKSIEDSVKATEFAETMKNLKPSVSDGATVKIVKSTPLKKETNYTWDDYFEEDK